MSTYTVILMLPDHVETDSTLWRVLHVRAALAVDAVNDAKHLLSSQHGVEQEEIATVAVFEGRHENLFETQ